ncbi:hypothetical protein NKG05_30795 [Oerskovia sp. M15]
MIAETRDKLAYWEGIRGEQVATGAATDYGRHNVAKGDAVKIGGYWRRVARANAKTVSVETGYSWTDRAPGTRSPTTAPPRSSPRRAPSTRRAHRGGVTRPARHVPHRAPYSGARWCTSRGDLPPPHPASGAGHQYRHRTKDDNHDDQTHRTSARAVRRPDLRGACARPVRCRPAG